MAFTEMTDDLDIIAKYPDEPYEEEGFTPSSFKASFDMAGKLCKIAINRLIRELGYQSAAANVGFNPTAGVNKTNIQEAIENVQAQIAGVSQGAVPDGSITSEKLDDYAVTEDKLDNGAVSFDKLDVPTQTWMREKYAVGDIFITTRSGNPTTLLGYGTWQEINERFLFASSENYPVVKATGGEDKHTLTVNEMPGHNHPLGVTAAAAGSGTGSKIPYVVHPNSASYYPESGSTSEGEDMIQSVGGGLAHNNMPPYYVVNMWLRTA